MKRWLLVIVLVLLPALVFAQGNATDFPDLFSVPDTDLSRYYLGVMFGPVGSSLSQGGSPLMGAMFRVFNNGVLSLGGLILVYIIFMATFRTSHEGEMLGEKWKSMFVPIRAVIGIALMLPGGSGYSFIQNLVMWIVVQGIGVADTLWAVVVDNYQGGVTVLPPPAEYKVDQTVQLAFKSLVCVAAVNKVVGAGVLARIQDGNTIRFGSNGAVPGYSDTACGSITVDGSDDAPDQAMMSATNAMLDQLSGPATDLVESDDPTTVSAAAISTAAQTYAGTYTAAKQSEAVDKDSIETSNDAKQYGWLFAGSYLLALIADDSSGGNYSYNPPKPNAEYDLTPLGDKKSEVEHYMDMAVETADSSPDTAPAIGNIAVSIDTGSGLANVLLKIFTLGLVDNINDWMDILSGNNDPQINTDTAQNPLINLQQLGKSILSTVEWTFIIGTTVVVSVTILMAVLSACLPGAWVVSNAIQHIWSILVYILIMLMIAGSILVFYYPMIPFIIFTIAGIGWIMGVFESMLAAPIVALGIIHPDGQHEIFGHANPAIMMLTNVFVRPSLMIFGLVGSVALSYITVAYFNFGFQIVMEKLFVGGISGITSTVAMLVIYTLLILAFIQKAFSLIYEVPDKIMAWVGHTGATPGSINAQEISQMLDTAKGGATTAGQVTGRAYAGISSGAISASNKAASAIGAAGGGGGGEATGGGGGGGMPAGGGNEEHMPKG